MQSLTVFLDTSVVLSGLASPTGGSAKLLQVGRKKPLQLVTTEKVIHETVKHLDKLTIPPKNLHQLISSRTLRLTKTPKPELIANFTQVTDDPDDCHILAGAVACAADILVSLDKKHLITPKVKQALKPIKVMTPKQFWHWISFPL